MRYHFYTADVFTEARFGGNQLAVIPDGRGLQSETMQKIAREFNFSETVFVLPPENPGHTRRIRIFTPAAELPFAGHPTVGTAHVLAAVGDIPLVGDETEIILEEGVGPVPVKILAKEKKPVFAQLTAARLPEQGPPPPTPRELSALLSLEESDLLSGKDEPESYSCGVPFLYVPLKNLDAARRARINLPLWQKTLESYWANDVYVFTYETESSGANIHSRMFAPAFGIAEDPATGSGAASLAGYLAKRDSKRDGTLQWSIEQGIEISRPSLLKLEVEKRHNQITAVRVGGSTVLVTEGYLEV